MVRFLKYFLVAMFSQLLFMGLGWIPPLAPFVAAMFTIFYVGPWMFFAPNPPGVKREISTFELFGIPLIAWSIVISGAVCVLVRINKSSERTS